MELILEVTDRQADTIVKALDLWARLGAGELTTLLSHPDISKRLVTDTGITTEEVRRLLTHLASVIFNLPKGTGYGILAKEIHESNRIAFDLMQAIRHRLVWSRAGNPPKRTPDMISIAYDEPMQTAKEPMPLVREKPAEAL